MELNKQVITIPLTGQLDMESSPFVMPAGSLVEAENVYRDRAGRWTPRVGRTALPSFTSNLNEASAVVESPRGELLTLGGRQLFVYNADGNNWPRRVLGGTSSGISRRPCQHRLLPLTGAATSTVGLEDFNQTDVAASPTMVCAVGEIGSANPSIIASFLDAVTSETLFQVFVSISSNGCRPRVVFAGGFFLVFWAETNTGELNVARYNPADLEASASTAVVTTELFTANDGWYDVQVRGDNGRVAIAYRSTSGGFRLRALEWNPSTMAASIAATTVAVLDADKAVAWLDQTAWSGNLYVATSGSTTGTRIHTLDTNLVVVTSPVVEATNYDVRNLSGYDDGAGNRVAVFDVAGASSDLDITRYATTAALTGIVSRGASLASKCKIASSDAATSDRVLFALSYVSNLTANTVLIDAQRNFLPVGSPVGQFDRGETVGRSQARTGCTSIAMPSATSAFMAFRKRDTVTFSLAGVPTFKHRLSLVQVEFSVKRSIYVLSDEIVLALSGAPLGELSGLPGFTYDPETPTLVANNAAGGALDNSAIYQYCWVWEYRDAVGRLWQSVPSVPLEVTTPAGGPDAAQIQVSGKTMRLSWSAGVAAAIVAALYRTEGGGSAFYRHPTIRIANDVLNDTFSTITDNVSDAELTKQERLYTDSGALESLPFPPFLAAVMVGSRAILLDAENRRRIWASQELVPGFGFAFHPGLTVLIEADGDNVAITAMDGRPIVFKRSAIYYITETWPDANGNGALPTYQKVSATIGAESQASVVQVPDGVMFKDAEGFFTLTRGLALQHHPQVDPFKTWTCVGAQAMPRDPLIRFVVINGVQGRELVWDYVHQTWSVYTLPDTTGAIRYVHSAVVGEDYYVLRSDGVLLKDDLATYRDNGSSYVCKITTGCLLAAGAEHNARTYEVSAAGQLMNTGVSPVMKFYYEGDLSTLVDTKTFNLAAGEFTGTGTRLTIKGRPSRQKGQALQASIEWTPTSTSGGVAWDTLALELGVKKGLRPTAAVGTK